MPAVSTAGFNSRDGEPLAEARVPLVDDGREHEVVVELGVAIAPGRLTAGAVR